MARLKDQRKNRRIYHLKPTFVLLKGRELRVHDISSRGMGLVLEEDSPEFRNGERLDTIPIPLETGPVNVKGIVTHISVNDTMKVCGILFQFEGDEFESIVRFKNERTLAS
jgi:hypothetical protein